MLVTGAFSQLFRPGLRNMIVTAYNERPKKTRKRKVYMKEPYKIELSWRPKRVWITTSRRYQYTKTKREATRLAKRIIVKADHRLKEFTVTIVHRRYGAHIDQWTKVNGKISRTK